MNKQIQQNYFFDKGLGIWGNENCLQCGACCYEWDLCKGGPEIREGKAFCLIHEEKKPSICERYFCGNLTDFKVDEREQRKKAREIAFEFGTVPKEWETLKKNSYQTYLELFCATYEVALAK